MLNPRSVPKASMAVTVEAKTNRPNEVWPRQAAAATATRNRPPRSRPSDTALRDRLRRASRSARRGAIASSLSAFALSALTNRVPQDRKARAQQDADVEPE